MKPSLEDVETSVGHVATVDARLTGSVFQSFHFTDASHGASLRNNHPNNFEAIDITTLKKKMADLTGIKFGGLG